MIASILPAAGGITAALLLILIGLLTVLMPVFLLGSYIRLGKIERALRSGRRR